MNASASNPTKLKPASKRIAVSALQYAWLKNMGVDVPWISAKSVQSATPDQPSLASKPQSVVTDQQPLDSARVSVPVVRAPEVSARAPQPELSLSGADLSQLVSSVHACQRCGLCQGRQNAVPGDGVDRPTILIVGEAPGEQEDAQGKPFVGRSGQLLDNMLKAIGQDRNTSVYITNVVKCRPPANRNPRDDEIAACAPFLARQIELLEPKVILAMGRFAAHALLQTDASLQELRQTTHEIQSTHKPLPVVVTYHPAYLLRRPVDKRLAWEDLKRLRALI